MTTPRELFDALLDELAMGGVHEPPPSPRDREVLYQRVVLGATNMAIAAALGMSVRTVEFRLWRMTARYDYAGVARMVRVLLEAYLERKLRSELAESGANT